MTAIAPVAPDIMAGRPPSREVMKPITNAAYKPVRGEKPASSAKAIASGTNANATVVPDRISVLKFTGLDVPKNLSSNLFING